MKNQGRILLVILVTIAIYFVLSTPYGLSGKTEENILDKLRPREINAGFDPLFGFCLYAPLLLFVESLFFKTPFKRWQVALLIVQLIGVVLTLPFAFFVPLGIPFSRVEPNFFALVIILWAIYVAFWHLFLVIPATRNWLFLSWPFLNSNEHE